MERRKNLPMHPPEPVFKRLKRDYETPDKSRIIETKPSIASALSSFKFGDERMIRAKHGLLERQSLENTALQAEGEDTSGSCKYPPNYFVLKLTFSVFSPNITRLHSATSHNAFSFQYMHLQLGSSDPATVHF